MKKIIEKIRWWYIFNFVFNDKDRLEYDLLAYGTHITKNGKRIDPEKFNPNPK